MRREEFRIQNSGVRSQKLGVTGDIVLMAGNKYWRRSHGSGRTIQPQTGKPPSHSALPNSCLLTPDS